MLSVPGFALACAISSCRLRTGTFGCAARIIGDFAKRMIGANARSESNGMFLYMNRLVESTPGGENISV